MVDPLALIGDETLTLYTVRGEGGECLKHVAGFRTGDYAVRRNIGDREALCGGVAAPMRDGDWLVDHIPTGMMVTNCSRWSDFAYFLADSLAQAVDGITTQEELAEALAPIVPWLHGCARHLNAGERLTPLRHWAAAHDVRLHPMPLELAEAAYG
jgi:hypothetical protein